MRSSSTCRSAARFAAACALAAVAARVDARAGDPPFASQYLRQDWQAEQGFPGGAVHAIAQTPDGFLWLGCEKGLVRFDGLTFTLVALETGPRSVVRVLGLAVDGHGDLWVRLQGARLLRLADGVFHDVLPSAETPEITVTAMTDGRNGSVLMATLLNGIVRHERAGLTTLAPNDALPRSLVIALADLADGRVLVGTRDAGLFVLAGGTVAPVEAIGLDRKINCLLPLPDGRVLVGTDQGVASWPGQPGARVSEPFGGVQTLALGRSRRGSIWAGTGAGVTRLDASAQQAVRFEQAGAVTAVFEDREGSMWLGTARGITRLRRGAFTTFAGAEGLPRAGGPVLPDGAGGAWVALEQGGVARVGESGPPVRDTSAARDVIYSLAGAGDAIWMGRQRGGLSLLSNATGPSRLTAYTRANGLAQDSVYAVHEGRDGTVWAGTLSGGVSRLDRGRFTTFTTADGLLSNTVTAIAETAGGSMWFATPRGISTYRSGQWSSVTASDGLPSNDVHSLLVDAAGLVWVGTAAGLARIENGRVVVTAGAPSLADDVFGIAVDRHGGVWVATASHVVRVDRARLLAGTLGPDDVREFGVADGLRAVDGVKRHRSVVAAADGRIWFSLGGAVSVVDPVETASGSPPAPIHVEGLSADGEPIALGPSVTIPPGHQRLAIAFIGASLAVPERVRYRYRMDGVDQAWSQPVTSREAVYANLPPAEYRFRVVASNSDGLWNGSEATLAFVVAPAYWQTAWFQLTVLAGLAGLAWVAYRWRLHAMSRQMTVRFEERLAERTRIAQDLHDTLLQGLVSVSMQLHVAAERVEPESPARPPLERVAQLMRQVIDEGRNAVRGLRGSAGAGDDLEQALSSAQRELAVGDAGEYRVVVTGRRRRLHPLIRDEVYRVAREALANAFRHAAASAVEVELTYASDQMRLLVRDDGRGIDPEVQQRGRDGHWGLSGMRERAERIGGRFTVWSRRGSGTEVELVVPAEVAYRDRTP